jgi:tRNA-specific 2-thiouridylase
VAKDLGDNALIVAQGEHELLFCGRLTASDAHWIGKPPDGLDAGLHCTARIRYRQSDQDCVVTDLGDGRLDVRFDISQRAAAPGQFVVFYDESLCLGGAAIDDLG